LAVNEEFPVGNKWTTPTGPWSEVSLTNSVTPRSVNWKVFT
jgi:hypothetical protein